MSYSVSMELKLESERGRGANGEKKTYGFEQLHGALAEYVTQRSAKVIQRFNGSVMASCICPGHDDRTPSMHVNGNLFHCHGCGKGGNLITLVMLCEGLTFGQTCDRIAAEFGESALPPNVQEKRAAYQASQAASDPSKFKTTTRQVKRR